MNQKTQYCEPLLKNLAGRNLMVYTFTNEDEIISYQAEMLANNIIKGILKADSMKMNGEFYLQYDVTSLVTIKKLFERRKLNRKDFIFLIRQIIELSENLEQYLLDSGGVVFDSTYVFVDPQDLKLEFAYLPITKMPHDLESLRVFLLDILINDIRFVDEPADNFVQRLIEILKNRMFSFSLLKEYIREIDVINSTPVKSINNESHIVALNEENQVSACSRIVPVKTQPAVTQTIKTTKLCYPAKSYIILYSVIGALIIFCISLLILGILSPDNPDFLLSLFGFLLMGGAVTYLVYSKLFSADKKVERIFDKKIVKEIESKGGEYVNKTFTVPIMANINAKKEIASTNNNHSNIPGSTIERSERIHNNPETKAFYSHKIATKPQDRTVLLDVGSLKLPHLKRILVNSSETIILKSFPFMLGRLEEQVDYCIKNPAVGKLHAEILKTSEGYFIIDMNSRNGTFINGEQIEPSMKCAIKSEDRINLGNEEFIFFPCS